MHDWWLFIEQDVLVIITGLEGRDLAFPISCLVMLALLLVPLKGIERDDLISGFMYIAYCIAAGTILFFAIPEVEKGIKAIGLHLAFVSLLGGTAAYRWFHNKDDLIMKLSAPQDASQPKSPEMNHEKV